MRSAALAALVSLAPGTALAEPAPPGAEKRVETYFGLHVGAYYPQSDDLRAIDRGVDLGATIGARFGRHAAVEVDAGVIEASGERNTWCAGIPSSPALRGREQLQGAPLTCGVPGAVQDLEIVPVTATARLRAPTGFGELSALGGAGVYLSSLYSHNPVSPADADTRSFGWYVGAGLEFFVWPTARVGVEGRYTFLTGTFDGIDFGLDGFRLAITASFGL